MQPVYNGFVLQIPACDHKGDTERTGSLIAYHLVRYEREPLMREHIRILGILNIIMGCLTGFAGLAVLLFTGAAAKIITTYGGVSDQDATVAAPILTTVGVVVGIFFLILAAPSIIGGLGLLNFRPWARILMIIVSIFHLFHIPFGTALGVYGLWVLFSDSSQHLLEGGGQAFRPVSGAYPVTATTPPANYPPPPPPSAV